MPLDDPGSSWFFCLRAAGRLDPKTIQAQSAHCLPRSPTWLVCCITWPVAAFRENRVKRVEAKLSSLKDIKAHEYVVRFLFGGLATVAAGLIARKFGPVIGGLFLAFPAIFPASASLIESHEKRRKAKIGSDGRNRGRMAASLDAQGASLGCIGLMAFALVLWGWLDSHNAWILISIATMVWLVTAYGLWAVGANRRPKRVYPMRSANQ